MSAVRRPGIGPLLAVAAASALAALFAAWALAGVATTSCTASSGAAETCVDSPLVDGFGAGALAVAAPLAVSLLVWWLLHRACSGGGATPRRAAAIATGALALVTLPAIASVGILLLPIVLLLVVAVATTVPATRR